MTKRRDTELIEEGRVLAKRLGRTQLKLGRLALEFAPMGEVGKTTGAFDRLEEYADEIGVPAGTLRTYRQVAAVWGAQVKDGEFPFNMLYRLMPCVEKEAVLVRLRREAEAGHPLTVDAAVRWAEQEGWMQRAPQANSLRRPLASLRRALTILEGVSLAGATPQDLDRLRDTLGAIEDEHTRLFRELRGLA